ncbi:uncharacterized protein DUF4905 [Marinoscillum furvescens DSM 4134]|uniref:Uncharacterized protein DUF4905 n=1 Tax=Marinoscillum furvescens DSM 4134 TaxID=1122208 RepID=A0A3D9L1M9_MARFU|nr:uncharacterized protein DUF4905 [Marinoscillum furvescens DSM 4134]
MVTVASFRFSLPVEGKLWQTAFDSSTGLLWMEFRDEELQRLFFRSVELSSGALGDRIEFAETDWWTSLLRVSGGYLLLEQYTDPQNPTEKSLLVYDAANHGLVNRYEDFQFVKQEGNVVYGQSLKNQGETKSFTLEIVDVPKVNEDLDEPVYYAPGSDSHSLVFDFLSKESSPVGCEYFEINNYIIISYYERSDSKFDRMLLVLKSGEEILHDRIDSKMSGFAAGGFFIFDGLLVYVKNGNEINGIEL